MTTASQLIDEMVHETRRVDLRAEITRYLNQTIRECHADPETNNVALFSDNYREVLITCDSDTGQTWTNPNGHLFQTELAVRFGTQWRGNGDPVYAERSIPGPAMERHEYYYYRAGDTFVFGGTRGYGGVGATIALAYYEYPRSLKYYATADRPATWDDDTGWTYHVDYSGTDELKELARLRVSNWLLMRWKETISEGLRAKVYKRLSDDGRQRTSYSMYQQHRRTLFTSEKAVAVSGF